jgi:ABC-type multidrug transport system ATPase subunit
MVWKMSIIDNNIKIEIFNLEATADCKMFNYGSMRDSCSEFNANLSGGNVYAVLGEFGSGGWALSYILSGNKDKYDFINKGSIKVNGAPITHNELRNISCYVGEEGNQSKWL